MSRIPRKVVEDKSKKAEIKLCSNCKFSSPSFNLLHCDLKSKSVGYGDTCDRWTKKEKKKETYNFIDF